MEHKAVVSPCFEETTIRGRFSHNAHCYVNSPVTTWKASNRANHTRIFGSTVAPGFVFERISVFASKEASVRCILHSFLQEMCVTKERHPESVVN